MKLFLLSVFSLLTSFAIAHPHSADSIHFNYTFHKSEHMDKVIQVNASITNQSSKHFYFLSESCNGLDYYITTTALNASVYIFVHCNATFPRKITLAPGASYEFKTNIKYHSTLKKMGLNLVLTQLSEAYQVDEKFISNINRDLKKNHLKLSGPVLIVPQ